VKIRYKTIEHERVEDAPFIGALISAIDCHIGCKGCFNQHIKLLPTIEKTDVDIIEEIKSNKFNKGIIFGGLEWSEQLNELTNLVNLAIQNDLEVMIYTGLTENKFKEVASDIYSIPNIYIKFGEFEDTQRVHENYDNGVLLATKNQYIKKT
jgi:MoaA/NifB/PqqE/SkfB family radical SAM enzyme